MEETHRAPIWPGLCALALIVPQLLFSQGDRRAAALLAGRLWQLPGQILAGTLFLSAALYVVTRLLAPLLSALALLSTFQAVRRRKQGSSRQSRGVLFCLWTAALLSAGLWIWNSFPCVPLSAAAGQAAEAWADLWTEELCCYEGPLEDFSADTTWEIQPLDTAASYPDWPEQPQLYRFLNSGRKEAPYSFLCPISLSGPLSLLENCSLYRWRVSYLPRTGVVTALEPCLPEELGPEEWSYGSCVYPRTDGTVPSASGQPLEILGYESLSPGQRRTLDLLFSGRLEDFLHFSDSWGQLRLDSSLTREEVRQVLDMYEILVQILWGGQTGFHIWQVTDSDQILQLKQISCYSAEERMSQLAEFCETADALAAEASRAGDNLAGIEAVTARLHRAAELVAARTDYQAGAPNAGNAYGALVQGEAVCQGYALAYAAVLYRLGIPCGVATGSGHAWNVVWLDGEPRHIDVTWMDSTDNGTGFLDDKWFLMTTAERLGTVDIDTDLEALARCLGVTDGPAS